jgi:hypothetical protein
MKRWLRVVLPSSSYLAILVVCYTVCLGGILCFEWQMGARLPELRQGPRGLVILAAVAYGLYRVYAFHPSANAGYRDWLATTPWTGRQPLPWPVHLVPQDAFVLAILCGMSWLIWPPSALAVLQAFLTAYLLDLAVSLFVTGEWRFGYIVAAGLGAAVWQWQNAIYSLVLGLVTYLLAYLGLQRSLRCFPWNATWLETFKAKMRTGANASALGWPFGRLAPEEPEEGWRIPLRHAVLISLLCGWWAFALVSLIHEPEDRANVMMIAAVCGILLVPIVRLALYCDGYAPPISLGGRIFTGRWLMPGYDQVFVAPLLAAFLGAMLLWVCWLYGVDLLFGGPPAISVTLLLILGMGPTLKEWRLTGNHQIVEGTRRNQALKVG